MKSSGLKAGPAISVKRWGKRRILFIVASIAVVVLAGLAWWRYFGPNSGDKDTSNGQIQLGTEKQKQAFLEKQLAQDMSSYTKEQKVQHYITVADLQRVGNKCSEAIENYKQALELDKTLAGVYISLARCSVTIDKKSDARMYYDLAISMYTTLAKGDEEYKSVLAAVKAERAKL